MAKVLGLTRRPRVLPQIPRLQDPKQASVEALVAAVKTVQERKRVAQAFPNNAAATLAYQQALAALQALQEQLAAFENQTSSSGRAVGDFVPPSSQDLHGRIDEDILSHLWPRYQQSIKGLIDVAEYAPKSDRKKSAKQAYSEFLEDLTLDAAFLQNARAMALTAAVGATVTGMTNVSATGQAGAVLLFNNSNVLPVVAYIRADSANQQIIALYLAKAQEQAVPLQAPIASSAAPFDAAVILLPNASVYGSVRISGGDTGVVIVTPIPLTGRAAIFGAS